uniref:Uncharacterized protein n=1 Tax=Erythrolobus australicus TaxID=1077150 RepID=A0A7S1XI98_9RHOD|mmetsp:Transcript_1884/g.4991  ORF Transcript_1884/g.4991 Transcript_1884/m.4991 type:complete len:269 (+) Transcript_1884:204-1010(+)
MPRSLVDLCIALSVALLVLCFGETASAVPFAGSVKENGNVFGGQVHNKYDAKSVDAYYYGLPTRTPFPEIDIDIPLPDTGKPPTNGGGTGTGTGKPPTYDGNTGTDGGRTRVSCVALATLHGHAQVKLHSSLDELVLGFWHEEQEDAEVVCFYQDEHVCVTPMHLVRYKELHGGKVVPAEELCAAGVLPCVRKRARVAAPVFRENGGVEWMRDIGVTSSAHTWHARELMFGWRVTLDARFSHALHEAGRLLWYVPRDAVRRALVSQSR